MATNHSTPNRSPKILYLAASPRDLSRLSQEQEAREIEHELRSTDFGQGFDIEKDFGVRFSDLPNRLMIYRPDIVHFGGHGAANNLVFEDQRGRAEPVSSEYLGDVFGSLKDNVRCVILNACYSEEHAKAIAKHVDCVVGVSGEIGEDAAHTFAIHFYRALGFGKDVKTAFNLACTMIGYNDEHRLFKPVLFGEEAAEQLRFGASENTRTQERTESAFRKYALYAVIAMIALGAFVLVKQIFPGSDSTIGTTLTEGPLIAAPETSANVEAPLEDGESNRPGLVPATVKIGDDETFSVGDTQINVIVHEFPLLSEGYLSDKDWVDVSITTIGSLSYRLYEGQCAYKEPFIVTFNNVTSTLGIVGPKYANFTVMLLPENSSPPQCEPSLVE